LFEVNKSLDCVGRFEEIASVNFARGGGTTRSFDFEVETKNGVVHTFSSIEKEEYGKLYDFITSKKLRVKNTGRSVTFFTTFCLSRRLSQLSMV